MKSAGTKQIKQKREGQYVSFASFRDFGGSSETRHCSEYREKKSKLQSGGLILKQISLKEFKVVRPRRMFRLLTLEINSYMYLLSLFDFPHSFLLSFISV